MPRGSINESHGGSDAAAPTDPTERLPFFVPIAVVIFALQVALSVWWLQYFRFGPFEWVWRSLTYGRREPLRRAPAIGRAVAAAHPQA